jgi:hypothetical protein
MRGVGLQQRASDVDRRPAAANATDSRLQRRRAGAQRLATGGN